MAPAGAQGAGEVRDPLRGGPQGRLRAPARRWQDVWRGRGAGDRPPAQAQGRGDRRPGDREGQRARTRIAEAIEKGSTWARASCSVAHVDEAKPEPKWQVQRFSQHFACENCGRGFEPLNPHHFSFNAPLGWCPTCEGLGVQQGASQALVDPRSAPVASSGRAGGVARTSRPTPTSPASLEAIAAHAGFSLDEPFDSLDPAHQRAVLHGTGDAWIPLVRGQGSAKRGQGPGVQGPAKTKRREQPGKRASGTGRCFPGP